MTYSLASHVHLAVLGEDVVLLDVAADRYSCMPGGVSALRPAPDLRSVAPLDPQDVTLLRDAGLLAPTGPSRPAEALPDLPRRTPPATTARLSPQQWARLGLVLWDLLILYRGARFREILEHVRRDAGPGGGSAAADVGVREAALFARALAWLPLPHKCLVRSFALLRFLRRAGVSATWVFGVRTWPFAAHCWVQLGDVALDDEPDRLSVYQPILAVPV